MSQSTFTVRPVPWTARWGLRQQLARQSTIDVQPPEVPSRIIAQSLRLTPTVCHVAKYLPSCAHRACQILHLTYYCGWILAQHGSQPACKRHLEWSKIVYGHAGQGRGLLAFFACSWWGVI